MLYLATDEGIVALDEDGGRDGLGITRIPFRAVSPHPRNSRWLVAASDEQGVFLWDGKEWQAVLRGVAHSVAWRFDGTHVFAGLRGVHLFVSDNEGRAWEEIPAAHAAMKKPGVPDPHISGHPLDILSLLVVRRDLLYLGVEAGGLLRSRDGGRAFEPASNGLHPDIHSLSVDPRNPDIVYAATGHGLYKTIDGGDTWARSDQGIDQLYLAAAFVLPGEGDIVLATGAPDSPRRYNRPGGARAAMFRSEDGGKRWVRVTGGLPESFEHEITAFAADPGSGVRVIAGTLGGEVWESMNAGKSWQLTARGLPGIWGVTFVWTAAL